MKNVKNDLDSLQNAISGLKAFYALTLNNAKLKAFYELTLNNAKYNDIELRSHRTATIKAMEFTFTAVMKSFTIYIEKHGESAKMEFEKKIAFLFEQAIVSKPFRVWDRFRDGMRNQSSHNYDSNMAIDILDDIPEFIAEVEFVYKALVARLKDD